MLSFRLLLTAVLSALSFSALSFSAAAEPPSPKSSPAEPSLAALRFEEQAAKFRRVNAEQIQLLEERILSRLNERAEPSIREYMKAPPNTGIVSGFVLGNVQWQVSTTGTPLFVRIVETQTLRVTEQHERIHSEPPLDRTFRVSQPVLSFEEAVRSGDIRRAMTQRRLEIDFEFLPATALHCG